MDLLLSNRKEKRYKVPLPVGIKLGTSQFMVICYHLSYHHDPEFW